ncbi:MAG: tRNA uridine-5-carboxymethylaminomethyl(34) synthesis GTPase MnmE [Oscillospiraceae bacterium]
MGSICAVSTALSEGALSVIRISGDNALEVAAKVFFPVGKKSVLEMPGYTCAYGEVRKNGVRFDDAVLTVFRAPHSYTGEDTAEISCHGGIYITKQIFRLCCEMGAKPAERGEFTKLAFLNGKMSLTQAESVMDVISAQGELTLRSANLTRQGRLFERINSVKQRLIKLLGELSAWVDYPEEDLPEVETLTMKQTIADCLETVGRLIKDYDSGMLLKSGIPAVIAGRPNVGKSTLMNMLLGYDRAIVTDIAGTTRDIIEETVRVGDVTLRLSDTAGLRETTDEVEKIGVELARRRLDESALVIAVFDGTVKPTDEDRRLIGELKESGRRFLALVNKSDIGIDGEYERLLDGVRYRIEISAKTGEGRERLEAAIGEMFSAAGTDDSIIFVNERQKNCLDRAAEHFNNALSAIELGMTLDAVTIDIGEAAAALSELTGERITETVVDEIFSKFCVGK